MDSSVFFIFAVVVVGTSLAFLFKFFLLLRSSLLVILVVEVVRVTCQPKVLAVAAVCAFSTDQLIVFCVKQALRGFGFCVKQALKGGVFTIDLHVSFQKKCEFYNRGGRVTLLFST